MSFLKRPIKERSLKRYCLRFAPARERIFIETCSIESKCVIGSEKEKQQCLQVRPCIFQPKNVTGWGSEGVKKKKKMGSEGKGGGGNGGGGGGGGRKNHRSNERLRNSRLRGASFSFFFFFHSLPSFFSSSFSSFFFLLFLLEVGRGFGIVFWGV